MKEHYRTVLLHNKKTLLWTKDQRTYWTNQKASVALFSVEAEIGLSVDKPNGSVSFTCWIPYLRELCLQIWCEKELSILITCPYENFMNFPWEKFWDIVSRSFLESIQRYHE